MNVKRAIHKYARTKSLALYLLADRKACDNRERHSGVKRFLKRQGVRAERALGRAIVRGCEEE